MRFRFIAVMVAVGVVSLGTLVSAAEKKEGPTIPDGLKGFSGQLKGTVTEVQDNGQGFSLKVKALGKIWENNKAEKPETAVGQTLKINANWQKTEGKQQRPVPAHVAFIKSLKSKESIMIEVINREAKRLHIQELTEEQRKRSKR